MGSEYMKVNVPPYFGVSDDVVVVVVCVEIVVVGVVVVEVVDVVVVDVPGEHDAASNDSIIAKLAISQIHFLFIVSPILLDFSPGIGAIPGLRC